MTLNVALSSEAAKYIGYFVCPDHAEPSYDPGPEAPCPLCSEPINAAAPRTISLLPSGAPISIFYRVHAICHDLISPQEASALDVRMMDMALGVDWGSDAPHM